MIVPDYKQSIVNTISAISHKYGYKNPYKPLFKLPRKKTVLLIIDAMGAEFIKKQKGFLFDNQKYTVTSVWPSTTAAAMTTYYTSYPPQQHGLTGWDTYVAEFGMQITVLKWTPKDIQLPLDKTWFKFTYILGKESLFTKLKVKSAMVTHSDIVGSHTSQTFNKNATAYGYNTLRGMFSQIKKAHKKHDYVFAYWPFLDSAFHKFGVDHKNCIAQYQAISNYVEKLAKNLKNTNIIVTADHGQCNCSKQIFLQNDHPEFYDCLRVPLNDPRMCFCYVAVDRVSFFKQYYKKHFAKDFTLIKSSELLTKNRFGLGKAHPKLHNRIGDFVLIAKGDAILKNKFDPNKIKKGFHGGASKEEMLVPVCIIDCP